MKKWRILSESGIKNQAMVPSLERGKSGIRGLTKILLSNRRIKTKKEIEEFLNPKLSNVTINNLTIDSKQLNKAVLRIKNAIKTGEKIVVFGDYDVDGICGTAILWETLNAMGANVSPYIPHRMDEGYGLSLTGISNIKNKISNIELIITVDNGIVANEAVNFANEQGIDVVITDHHVPSKKLPKAYAIVHTTKLCGTGVAYLLAQAIHHVIPNSFRDLAPLEMLKRVQHDKEKEGHLELVALATVADLVPLVGANRALLKFGLEELRKTQRVGLKALFEEAGIESSQIGVYEIGHVIAPRLNAMGRLEYAMDSLRLLCTNNKERAKKLAQLLGSTNRERQELTFATVNNSKLKIQNSKLQFKNKKLLFIADKSYEQGIIGLVAGKLVEEFYRPSIVVSIGEKYSKASARSVAGFNIIEFIRTASEMLVDAGGHPMAAGFTIETVKLAMLEEKLLKKSEELLDKELLTRTLKIDCEIPLGIVGEGLYHEIQKLSPFGMGNPEPTFISRGVIIEDMRLVGAERKHIKFVFSCHPEFISGSRLVGIPKQVRNDKRRIDAIAFGMGERSTDFHIGDKVDVVYTVSEDSWNGSKRVQLKIKDIS